MPVLWRIIVKEFLQLRQDPRMIRMILIAPVIQIIIFGFAVNFDVRDTPMLLVDQDRSAESRELVDRFLGSGYFDIAGTAPTADSVGSWLVAGKAQLALVIDRNYHELGVRGRPARVQAIADGSDANTATVALGYASSIIAGKSREMIQASLRRVESGSDGGSPVEAGRLATVPRVYYNPDLKSRWYYVPAVLAMVLMMMTLNMSAMGIVREKEIGTMEQLIVTPIRPWQLVCGKLFPFLAIGFLEIFLVSAVAVFGFGVPLRGSFVLLLGLSLLFISNTLGLGLLLSTLVENQQQAMMTASYCLMVPMLYLSGLIFPIENMPRAVQMLTYAVPVRYYAIILRGIFLKGSGLDVLWPETLTLALMGTAIAALAAARFRKKLD